MNYPLLFRHIGISLITGICGYTVMLLCTSVPHSACILAGAIALTGYWCGLASIVSET